MMDDPEIETESVDKVRDYFGMPKLTERDVRCRYRGCQTIFKAQFEGEIRRQYFCRHCIFLIERERSGVS